MATPNWVKLKIHMYDGQVKCLRVPVETDKIVELNMSDLPTSIQLAILSTSNPSNPHEIWDSFINHVPLRDYKEFKKHIENADLGKRVGKNL